MGFAAMKPMKLAIIGGAVAAIALLSACSANSVDGNAAPKAQESAQVGQGGAGGGGLRAGQPKLRFPNTTPVVSMIGYDAKLGMVQFRVMDKLPTGGYAESVTDQKVHRLPLDKNATVISYVGLCPEGSPSLDDSNHSPMRCGAKDLIAALNRGDTTSAELNVDGADRITRVTALYF
ncbi:hypothetical protein [Amycolatopsis jejuensis]|uniref:hypothetical protein n=1 Tax=Amycolatopsis jejuensis TaxID=330084 RepID=UPI000526BCE6|nr:hypothetical protein [Amycolatopsis jejuensis]